MTKSLKLQTIKGVVWVGLGRLVVQVALTGGNIVIARLLLPDIWGQFAIISYAISLVGVFVNLSMGQAIAQSETEPTEIDLRSAFWVKIGLGLVGWMIVMIGAPEVIKFYGGALPDKLGGLIIILGSTLVLLNARSVSAHLLERRLEYGQLIFVESLEVVVTQILVILFAMWGFGVASFVWGQVLGRLVGTVAILKVGQWGVGWGLAWESCKKYLKFAATLQLQMVVGLVNSALIPVYIGRSLGVTQVGILAWAGGIALGSKVVADIIARVVFPAAARLQSDSIRLSKLIGRSLLVAVGINLPVVIVLLVFAKPLVSLVYSSNWLVGVPVLYLYLLIAPIGVIETVVTRVWLGVGGVSGLLRWSVMSGVTTWLITILLMKWWGVVAVPLGGLAGSLVMVVGMIVWWRGYTVEKIRT